jgi:hypothetical protein
MAVSICLKCAGHSFELASFTPLGARHKLTIVQCSGCGAPIGVLDPATGPQIEALKNQIAAIGREAQPDRKSAAGLIDHEPAGHQNSPDALWNSASTSQADEAVSIFSGIFSRLVPLSGNRTRQKLPTPA